MAVSWNKDQLKAIETTDKGVIVSAAAGSGKTAVLIERTIRLLVNEENKIPADKLLAVTFTKDATNQMKDKLSAALEKKLNENPSNEWIQKQMDNLNLAKINTINAFCLDIVKNNLQDFDLQSGVKILEDVDAAVIISDSVKSAFEFIFETEPELMEFLIDRLTDNNQKALEKIVTDMYYFLRSLPFPDDWVKEAGLNLISEEKIQMYVKILLNEYLEKMLKAYKKSEYALTLLNHFPNVDKKNKDMFLDDRDLIEKVCNVLRNGEWSEAYNIIINSKFSSSRITLKLPDNCSVEQSSLLNAVIDELKQLRSDYKETLKNVVSDINKIGRNLFDTLRISADVLDGLYKLCLKTEEIAWEAKTEKNAIEFADAETLAVKLLVKKTDNGITRTMLANEIVRNRDYQVILIDEFQDVNNLQELIFKAISDTDDLSVMGKNVFVVGDVKQSIYRFRQSNPLLFINAKDIADNDDYNDLKSIQLNMNYRSRKNIIDYVNYTFSLLMSKTVGEIDYDSNEELNLGASYKSADFDTEIMLIKDTSDSKKPEDDSESDENNTSENLSFDAEHLAVAKRIKEMYENRCVVEDGGQTRPSRPSDFCVLSRGKTDGLKAAKALQSVGLKAYTEETSGYLRSREIAIMISLLKVIDNPMQDIPLVAVMMSPVFGFSADEIAVISLLCKNENKHPKRIYQVLNSFDETNVNWQSDKAVLKDNALEEKCIYAVKLIKRLRFYSVSMNLEHLIRKIYDETDFFAVASAFENSKQKRANLRLLLELASSYENNSDGGIAGFLRYIEASEKNGGEFKQAVTVTESADSVIIKTIHKSKGLEYPFVFLCGLSRDFNLKDTNKRVLFNERLGAAMKIADHEVLSITEPVNYKAQQIVAINESLSEELRLLYVAMTRAKEKLFIVLNLRNRQRYNDYKMICEKAHEIQLAGGINPSLVKSCKNFAQWIYITLLLVDNNQPLLDEVGIDFELPKLSSGLDVKFAIYDDIENYETVKPCRVAGKPIIEKVHELKQKYDYNYISEEINSPAKLTVTEIVSAEKEKDFGEKNPEFYPQLPRLAEEITKLTASERGTYTHLFMELADYENAYNNINDELERLYREGFFTEKEKSGVYKDAIKKFFAGEFYERMRKSSEIMREKRFLVSFRDIDVGEKYQEYINGNGMLQGIADCIFKEDDGYVLVDYKTDNFKSSWDLLKYQTQLELYKAALDMILDEPIKSCYIYSFKLSHGVEINF